jgi:acetyl esterase/lipase
MRVCFPLLLAAGAFLTMSASTPAADDPFFHLAGTRAYRPPKETVEILPRIEIGTGGNQTILATVFRPQAPSERLRPAVVFIHGGGWKSGRAYNTFGAWLAERGYVVASIGYRLNTEAKWPAQIEDCKLGVRWLRANAEKYGVDPDRIGAYGTSAGGHLAACAGVMQDPALEGTGGWEGTSSRVQAVAALNPPTDLTGDWLPAFPPPAWVEELFGVPRESNPELWKQASPAQNVQLGAPPFFLAHGEDDTHVPFTQGQKLHEALTAAGATVEWIPVKNGQHGFFVDPSTPESNIEPTREAIMQGLLDFFDAHLRNAPPGT